MASHRRTRTGKIDRVMQGPVHFHVAVQPYRMHGRVSPPASPKFWTIHSPMEDTSHISKQMHGHPRLVVVVGYVRPNTHLSYVLHFYTDGVNHAPTLALTSPTRPSYRINASLSLTTSHDIISEVSSPKIRPQLGQHNCREVLLLAPFYF